MSNSTVTPQAVQARAAAALTQLLTEHPDAPTLTWTLSGLDLSTLSGHAFFPDSDDDARQAITAWAAIIGANVIESRKTLRGSTWTRLGAVASAGGVTVELITQVDRTEAPAVAA